jgi:glycerate kinase
VAAPDKFRGTASAAQVARAAAHAARRIGWSADEVPMSDGGEGLLEAVGGAVHVTRVAGPLGEPVDAEWRLLSGAVPTAVIEMSRAAGRALVVRPRGDDPVRAGTAGVGELIVAAAMAGARRIVIGCGGSATTDGGVGAYEAARRRPGALDEVELVIACDVTTRFLEAAVVFGPQKGATPAQVEELTTRLRTVADRYRRETGVDVTRVDGAGAAGGLAGGLLALGARLEPGFAFVAELVHLAERIRTADLVVTGEGHLDPPSFRGKVPGGVLDLARRRREGPVPVLCVVGASDRRLLASPPEGMDVVSLTARFGRDRSRRDTLSLIAHVTAEAVAAFAPEAPRRPH